MKKLFTIFLLSAPVLAFSQAMHLATDVNIPQPHLASNPNAKRSSKGQKKLQAPLPSDLTTTGGTTNGGVTVNGTSTGWTASTANPPVITGGMTVNGTTTAGVTTNGITYDPTTGAVVTGGTVTGATVKNGVTVGGTITGGTNSAGIIKNGVVMGGVTQGGTATGGVLSGGTYKFSALVVNTNFTVPLVRVNFLNNKPQNATNSLASTSFFNSVGAGVNLSWGELDIAKGSDNSISSVDYYNHIGFQLGVLFAANSTSGSSTTQTDSSSTPTTTNSGGTTQTNSSTTTSSQSSTIFAIVAGIDVLNFQAGAGYELGSVAPGQKRLFVTISYAIPMSVLINGGYKVLRTTSLQ